LTLPAPECILAFNILPHASDRNPQGVLEISTKRPPPPCYNFISAVVVRIAAGSGPHEQEKLGEALSPPSAVQKYYERHHRSTSRIQQISIPGAGIVFFSGRNPAASRRTDVSGGRHLAVLCSDSWHHRGPCLTRAFTAHYRCQSPGALVEMVDRSSALRSA